MAHRFYFPAPLPALDAEFSLPVEVFHHAVNVMRLRSGDALELFDGNGLSATAHISFIEKKSARARLVQVQAASVESPLHITLAQCLSAGDKMDWTIEKAVELGVSHIVPIFSAKSQIKLTPERAAKKLQHWRKIIVAACAQSGRNVLPTLSECMTIKRFLANQKSSDVYKLLLHPSGAVPFKRLPTPSSGQKCTVLIGPESGFDVSELENAQAVGFTNTILGPRILRTESAGLAAIACIQAVWGDF
jgi:16S rRNA (uracil1498-N3)-methyltransferase